MNSPYAFALIALSGTLLFSACNKDDDDTATPAPAPTPAPAANASTTPTFPGAAGSLWAVNTVTRMTVPFVGSVEVDYGTGVGVFWNGDNSAYVSAGALTLNGAAMTETASHAYTTAINSSNPTGTDFSSGVDWTVAGANGIPAFSRSFDASFPYVDTVSSATTVVRANGYTLTTAGIAGADSVIFTVGSILKTKAAGTTSCTFSASELSGVTAGSSIVQVAGYTWTHEVISGKDIYFGKETVQTRSVTIQ